MSRSFLQENLIIKQFIFIICLSYFKQQDRKYESENKKRISYIKILFMTERK